MVAGLLSKNNFIKPAREALDRDIKQLWATAEKNTWERDKIIQEMRGVCKRYHRQVQLAIRRDFFARKSGGDTCRLHSKAIDILLLRLVKFAERLYGGEFSANFALLAVGGYGRQELAPYSDVDIVFTYKKTPNPNHREMIDFILYGLWDLGIQLGHAVRSIAQNIAIARQDQTVATALLESRIVTGDRMLHNNLRKRFMSQVIGSDARRFAQAKLDERDRRHERMGNTRYVLEPNIKEGKGGLRDLHLMRWVALSFYRLKEVNEFYNLGIFTAGDVRAFDRAMDFFVTLRVCLHYLSARPQELLTFDMQMQLADEMGYRDSHELKAVERLMRSYFLHATDAAELTRILATDMREKITPSKSKKQKHLKYNGGGDFIVTGGRLNVEDLNVFVESPVKVLQIFALGLHHNLDFHPNVFRAIRKAFTVIYRLRDNPQAYKIFLQILNAREGQERILRILSESGFLGRFLLDFGKVQAQMQYDMYHVYTTDEHTIRAVGNINRLERGDSRQAHPLASEEIQNITCREVLYMAIFLHDIAKGQKGDHSELGAELALRLCPKFGFDEQQCQLVSWLVRYHLLMSNTAFKRNLDDVKTIADFVEIVQTKERLRLLLCLTVADITAVGPATWNNWKAHLIRLLYRRAETYMDAGMTGDDATEANLHQAQEELSLLLAEAGVAADRQRRFLQIGSPSYYLSYTPQELARHAAAVLQIEKEVAENDGQTHAVDLTYDAPHEALHLLIYADDSEGLLAKICGAIALSGFNIVDAKVNNFTGNKILNSFTVQNSRMSQQSPISQESMDRLQSLLQEILRGDLDNHTIVRRLTRAQFGGVAKRTDVFSVTPQVDISNSASKDYTMIEVTGRDRIGLLFALSDTLYHLNLTIGQARIATFGEQAHDVFYVQNANKKQGKKITDDKSLYDIRRKLLQVLQREAIGYI